MHSQGLWEAGRDVGIWMSGLWEAGRDIGIWMSGLWEAGRDVGMWVSVRAAGKWATWRDSSLGEAGRIALLH